ncbi:hypothetical protein IKQ26_03435 [bacterium]|nr:hypothetical protein [bacterium]
MNKYFHYFHPSCSEGTSSVSFAYDSTVIPLKELLMFELQQIAYYIFKLSSLGVDISAKRDRLVDFITVVITNLYLKREKFEFLIKDLEDNKDKLEELYISACAEKSVEPEVLTEKEISGLKAGKIKEIGLEERQNYLKNSVFPPSKRVFYEIIMKLVQSASILITELKEYGINDTKSADEVVKILAKCNFSSEPNEVWEKTIDEFSKVNYRLNLALTNVLSQTYGPVNRHKIPTNAVKGKAILVTGHFYKDLEKILEATKGLDINVYTHADLLMAHSYEKFSKYPHLKGHYQRAYNNIQLDFASFPGPILITSHSIPHTEIIRGQIYTVDNFSVFGLARIENDDFEPVIKYAQNAQGFLKDTLETRISVGYDSEEIKARMEELGEKVNRGEIKHIFVLGGLDRFQGQDNYFKNFMDKCGKDCFVISFSYNFDKENLLHINSHYDFQLLWGMLEKLNREYGLKNYPISVFLTRCNSKAVSNIFNLRALGIKDIYLPPCFPNVMNPNFVKGLVDNFGVKMISDSAKEDIEKILNG